LQLGYAGSPKALGRIADHHFRLIDRQDIQKYEHLAQMILRSQSLL
jgi:hypothetical protein